MAKKNMAADANLREARQVKKSGGPRVFPGFIDRNCVYTLDELAGRMRVSGGTLRQAFKRGLKAKWLGNSKVVTGEDFYSYVNATPKVEPGPRPGGFGVGEPSIDEPQAV